jgi:biopolymer transport protein ExbB/TolQ
MRASAEHVGRKGRCPACKTLIEIRAQAGEESLVSLRPAGQSGVFREADARLSSTSVSTWQAGAIGAAVTLALYLALFLPLKNTYLGQLFLARGPMQHCTTLVTCWGLAMLALKYRAVRAQLGYAGSELELIPLEIGLQITPDNVDQFLNHLAGLPRAARLSILGRRIQGALEHFKSRTSVPEVQQYLATQAELDASGVDAGYTLLRAFIWVIPLLGFIGTVTGIGFAVSGLDAAVSEAGSQATGEHLMRGLTLVTGGLAVAFDTTFLALVMAIVLLFPTESLRRTEYGMLDRIEAFANDSLLRRMSDERATPRGDDLPELVCSALDSAFKEHQRWLAQWQTQVSQLGRQIGADFESTVSRVFTQAAQADAARMQKMEQLVRLLEELLGRTDTVGQAWRQARADAETQSRVMLEAAGRLQQALADNAILCADVAQQQHHVWEMYSSGSAHNSLAALAEQIGCLAARIEALARRPETAPRRTDVIEPDEPGPAQGFSASPDAGQGFLGRFWKRRR